MKIDLKKKDEIRDAFLMDLIVLLKEDAFKARKEYIDSLGKSEEKFYQGKLWGYWAVFDTIRLQLRGFQVNLKKVKFDFDPDLELRNFNRRK